MKDFFVGPCTNRITTKGDLLDSERELIQSFVFDKLVGKRFHVTDRHILLGTPREPDSCPLAKSVYDNFELKKVNVGAVNMYMDFAKQDIQFQFNISINKPLSLWITGFDVNDTADSIEVEIKIENNRFTIDIV